MSGGGTLAGSGRVVFFGHGKQSILKKEIKPMTGNFSKDMDEIRQKIRALEAAPLSPEAKESGVRILNELADRLAAFVVLCSRLDELEAESIVVRKQYPELKEYI